MTSAMPNAKRSRVRFVARTNGVGIDRDVGILARIVGDWGGDAAISHHRSISPLARLVPGGERDDCIFFLERIKSRWLGSADRFVLIPNQERFPKRLTASLGALDHVLVKTRHAEQVFAPHHPSVRYIGFTSVDRRIDGALPDYDAFFHLAGGSSLKGTDSRFNLTKCVTPIVENSYLRQEKTSRKMYRGPPQREDPKAVPAHAGNRERILPQSRIFSLRPILCGGLASHLRQSPLPHPPSFCTNHISGSKS
jgi:hypothetical protein